MRRKVNIVFWLAERFGNSNSAIDRQKNAIICLFSVRKVFGRAPLWNKPATNEWTTERKERMNVVMGIVKGVFRTIFFVPIWLWKRCFAEDYVADKGYFKAFFQFLACTIIFYAVIIWVICQVF